MDYEKGGGHRFRKLASLDRGSRQYSEVVEVELELFIALMNLKKLNDPTLLTWDFEAKNETFESITFDIGLPRLKCSLHSDRMSNDTKTLSLMLRRPEVTETRLEINVWSLLLHFA